jgi:hypothetical protein
MKYYILMFLVSLALGASIARCERIPANQPKPGDNVILPTTLSQFGQVAVLITDTEKTTGGSGVVYLSNENGSIILSNKHICGVIQRGGLVNHAEGKDLHTIVAYKPYRKHDLCLIYIKENLNVGVEVAKSTPPLFELATTVGHPNLLPTIITKGHFSAKLNIKVAIGTKPCDGDEDGEELVMCMFTGVKPVIKEFDTQTTSSTIQPGSSGSGVYNSRGELAGLVFAGAQGMSYSHIVPLSFLKNFLETVDFNTNNWVKPDPSAKPKELFSLIQLRDHCATRYSKLCRQMVFPGIYGE